MGKVCPLCKRQQPKREYTNGNAKKKKGKAAACNDCKAAGGDCVKLLSPAGFALAGIPGGHNQCTINGIYSKTNQIVEGRHVYSGPNGLNAWYFDGSWCMGDQEDIGTAVQNAFVNCLAASPASISSVWTVMEW